MQRANVIYGLQKCNSMDGYEFSLLRMHFFSDFIVVIPIETSTAGVAEVDGAVD